MGHPPDFEILLGKKQPKSTVDANRLDAVLPRWTLAGYFHCGGHLTPKTSQNDPFSPLCARTRANAHTCAQTFCAHVRVHADLRTQQVQKNLAEQNFHQTTIT